MVERRETAVVVLLNLVTHTSLLEELAGSWKEREEKR